MPTLTITPKHAYIHPNSHLEAPVYTHPDNPPGVCLPSHRAILSLIYFALGTSPVLPWSGYDAGGRNPFEDMHMPVPQG